MPAETLTKVETKPSVLPAETLTKVETKPEVLPAETQAKVETKPEVLPAETLTKVETKPEFLPAETQAKVETKPALVTEVEKTETTQVVVAANPVESVKESQPTLAVESKETPAIVPPTAAETMPVVGTNTAVDLRNKEIVTQTETAGVNDAAPKELLPIYPTVEKPTEDNSTAAVTEPVKQEVAQNNNNVNADWIARLESIKQRLSNLGGADVVAENAIDRTLIARLQTMTEKLREQTGATPISDNTGALISRLEDMVVKVAPPAIAPVQFEFPQADRPLVGFITDTGLTVNNPAEEKIPIVAEEKPANSTNNPSPSANGVNSNPSQPVVRTQDNSSQWVESLIKFVDAAKVSKQPHAVVNININLTQTQPDGTVIPRKELTAAERSAIAYAYQNNVIIVVPAGDNPGTMSALGLLSKEVDNVVTVGAAQRFNDSVALSNAFKLADYSGSGNTLDILAKGSSGSTSSTKVAAVEVTNAIAQVLAANPKLNYTQAIDAIKRTATDLARPNWDAQTGSGLLNVAAAVQLAKVTIPELYTIKPGQRSITDVFISQHPSTKQLPGDPTPPAVTVPGIPQTNVDRGSNNLANATQLIPSATEDVIDQVSSVDPSDIYRVDSRYLNGAKFSVLSGDLSVSYLTTSGQLLGTQSLSKGSHKLQLPANAPAEVIVKIDRRNADPATYVLSGFESTATEPFNIDLEYETPLSASQQAIMQAAAKSVAGLIGKGLPSAVVDGKIIDDINIKISTATIDGASGTQARTKIDFMRYGTMLPAQSLVQFDAADIAELERSGKLFSVVQHEFLHALGFGNLWEAKGLVDYAGTPLAQYNGGKAVDAFKDLGGLTDAISLETEGKGSAGFHWNEALFQDEVMTADLNLSGKAGNAPISPVTIASLADLGYEVNLNAATPDFGLFGGQGFSVDDLTLEQIEAFRQLAEISFEEPGAEYIAPIMPMVDPDKVSPEIWAHAERFSKNGEYYDWVPYQIPSGVFISHITERTMGNGVDPDYWAFVGNKNGLANVHRIAAGDWIYIPQHHPNYEWKQEQERLQREEELRQRQEEEARIRREQEEAFARDQERVRQEEEARRREAEAKQRELEEQERRLREEMERRRQEEERRLEEARLAELARQAEIARQQGKGGLDWYVAKPLPEFGPVDPFETSLTGETVGNLVPDDYYRFTLSRGGRITAELKKLLADADLVLYDVRNEPIAYSMREGITDEQIIADLIPGTYMLRVNSPKGVTTDYELIVKFKHKLSQSELGLPGWKPGISGNNGGGASGPLLSDPRIQRIYDTALANFAGPERAKANAEIAQLEREKRSYEQQMQDLLNQMNAEQRQKVHQALDNARNEANSWVDGIANPIKGQVDNLADGIINKANSFANSLENTVNQVPDYGIGWVKDRKNDAKWLINQGRDAVKSAVNSARSWLRGKLTEIQDGVNSAIQQFFDTIKNAYRTGAEINQIIANAAQTFRTKVDQAVRGANNLIGEFKGHVLSATDWTKNLGINVDKFGVKFNFNVYNNIVKPAVDGVADGFQSTISGIGSGLKGIVDWIEPRTQKTVADIVNAILGDKTGHLWNQINGVDAKIAATRTGVEKAIAQKATELKNQLQGLLNTLGIDGKKLLDTILNFGNSTGGQVTIELIKVALGFVPIVGQAIDVVDTALALWKVVVDGRRDVEVWVELLGSLAGWFPGVGDAIKGIAKVALKSPIGALLRKLGPDVTKQAAKIFKEANWKAILADVVEGLAGVWRKFDSQMDSAAGWILDLMPGVRPAMAAIGEIVVKFNDEAADAGKQLDNISKQIAKKIDDTSEQIAKEDQEVDPDNLIGNGGGNNPQDNPDDSDGNLDPTTKSVHKVIDRHIDDLKTLQERLQEVPDTVLGKDQFSRKIEQQRTSAEKFKNDPEFPTSEKSRDQLGGLKNNIGGLEKELDDALRSGIKLLEIDKAKYGQQIDNVALDLSDGFTVFSEVKNAQVGQDYASKQANSVIEASAKDGLFTKARFVFLQGLDPQIKKEIEEIALKNNVIVEIEIR
ncbi:S8 family serine peptidase [Microcoleus sp. B5-D4]|uniref:S8 family serine peptidase n=1 Tax=unclassified Microcoleus TaxID=2642155 RepID=UPI002FD26271